MSGRLTEATQWLAGQFSATRDEFRREHKAGSDMLLDGMLSQGYAHERGGRFAVSEKGRRMLAAVEPATDG